MSEANVTLHAFPWPFTVEPDDSVPDDEIHVDWIPTGGKPQHVATIRVILPTQPDEEE